MLLCIVNDMARPKCQSSISGKEPDDDRCQLGTLLSSPISKCVGKGLEDRMLISSSNLANTVSIFRVEIFDKETCLTSMNIDLTLITFQH